MKKRNAICSLILAGVSLSTLLLQGCGSSKTSDGKIEVELLQLKRWKNASMPPMTTFT